MEITKEKNTIYTTNSTLTSDSKNLKSALKIEHRKKFYSATQLRRKDTKTRFAPLLHFTAQNSKLSPKLSAKTM